MSEVDYVAVSNGIPPPDIDLPVSRAHLRCADLTVPVCSFPINQRSSLPMLSS
jgi:hypothetical protein